MLKKIGLLLWLITLTLPHLSAQKTLKQIRTYLKDKKADEAMKLVEQMEKDTTTTEWAKLYDYAKQAQIIKNDKENEKLYLKQAYDTAALFNTALLACDYILKCDEAEQKQQAQEGDKPKYRKTNARILHDYYANIHAGGRWFYARKDYASAMRLLSMALDLPTKPIWGEDRQVTAKAGYTAAAQLYLWASFHSKKWEETNRYRDIALADTLSARRTSLEMLSLAAEALKDTADYKALLLLGHKDYPSHPFFFTHLADLYARNGQYDRQLSLADHRLSADATDAWALEAKSLALINLKRYDEAITAAEQCIANDSTHTDAWYYVGLAYYSMAKAVTLPANINSKAYQNALARQKQLYTLAQPYMEEYRTKKPDEKAKWAPILYQIYFSLNLGSRFEEMQEIIKTLAD